MNEIRKAGTMDQGTLAKQVKASLDELSFGSPDRRYLSNEEAIEIVEVTLGQPPQDSEADDFKHHSDCRNRFVEILRAIPLADGPDRSCLFIGSDSLIGFWAIKHLGYASVAAIEMMNDSEDAATTKEIGVGEDACEQLIYNFDVRNAEWPISKTFDTILFLEAFAQQDTDPSGVLANISKLMTDASVLVVTVPNAASHETLGALMRGMPPFSHKPRMSYEFTPFLLVLLLRSAGFEPSSLKTIVAYQDREGLDSLFAIGRALGARDELFGDTIILAARKALEEPLFPHPDYIYNSEQFYHSTWPIVDRAMQRIVQSFHTKFIISETDQAMLIEHQQFKIDQQMRIIKDLREIIDVYQSRSRSLKSAEPTEPLVHGGGMQAQILSRQLETLSAACSRGTRKVAQAPDVYLKTSWLRILFRHPFKVSTWQAARRLQRRSRRN